jgi:hypothetical protein
VTDWLFLGALDRAARRYAGNRDPLVEASNWAALTVGSHLPFWPLYVWWAAGVQAFPTALLTVSLTPVFLAIPGCPDGVACSGGSRCPWLAS